MINILLYQILEFTMHGKRWKSYTNNELNKNNEFKTLAPTWNQDFELPDGSYSVPDIEDYFEYIWKIWRKDWWSFNKNIHR